MGGDCGKYLVFTDLDGTLLDHYSYSHKPAQPLLRHLQHEEIPVIPVSSKTRAELEPIMEQLGESGPFIVENGAAVCIPAGYFPRQPGGTELVDGYWVRALAEPRAHWTGLLNSLATEFTGAFETFSDMGGRGIAAATGLHLAQATLANRREFSEPVRWLADETQRQAFIARLRQNGAWVHAGGRFLAVGGKLDKGEAMDWLRRQYIQQGKVAGTVALGDSANDIPMLEAADTAILVRSPERDYPALTRTAGVIRTESCGPVGWAEGIARWLRARGVEDR
ncbi:MAG: HAD-IIB family hydrolase [Halioglobus sp.]|nr:HAD-IIB family hydrolase [Halioglobus sp.]